MNPDKTPPGPGRRISRRGFMIGASLAASGGLIALGYAKWPLGRGKKPKLADQPVDPSIFIKIDPDNTITLLSQHLEMGQGILTGLATVVANEMDAGWSQMKVEHAPADASRFKHQATTASSSLARSWDPLRRVGAAARSMLIAAAAKQWNLDPAELTVSEGVVSAADGAFRASFGDLAEAAAAQRVPKVADLTLKTPAEWTLVGQNLPRIDAPPKVEGRAVFGMDVRRPDMVRAVIARPDRFGSRPAQVDASQTLAIAGVLEVFELPSGVAVLANDTWTAMKGREALSISWDETGAETRSSDQMFADYRALLDQPGIAALRRGDAPKALGDAAQVLAFEYQFPYLAHAAMEPLNAVIERTENGARVWAGSQIQQSDQATVARVLGLERPEQVQLETVLCGSSFGRRADSLSRWIEELALVARDSKLGRPIHLVWTREDDMRGGHYRPMAVHRGKVGLDDNGNPTGWEHAVACQSIVEGTPWNRFLKNRGYDRAAVGGFVESSYAMPSFWVDWCRPETPVPVAFWRSVGDSQTGFVTECVIDELAHVAGRDPLTYRLDLLQSDERQRRTLQTVADRVDWGSPLGPGRGRGLAATFDDILQSWPRTYIAMAAEVVVEDQEIRVERIVAAVDCGTVVNPDIVVSQVEGSISFALSTALRNEITFEDGYVQQSNFDLYEPTRSSEMPKVEVYLLPSDLPPTGIGEAVVAPVAPAIANAVFDAIGVRVRKLPIDLTA